MSTKYRSAAEYCAYPINSSSQRGIRALPEGRVCSIHASLTLADAAEKWLELRSVSLKPRTLRTYKTDLKPVIAFWGNLRLKNLTISHFRRYQQERKGKACPSLVNRELGVLQQILKKARCWQRIGEFYEPLRVPRHRAGHSLAAEEERRLLEVAFSQPKWHLAAHCMTVMLWTTMGFGELRQLRRRDVDMERHCITVREGAKNTYRERTIPLNASAYESMTWILERWKKLGGSEDEHYILPHRPRQRAAHWRKHAPYILTEPTTSIQSAFRRIRKAAGLPYLRVYDMRVQAITKLLSNPAVSPQVSKEIAGHISQAMQDRYSIQQFDTKMAALVAIEQRTAPSGAPEPPNVPLAPADTVQLSIQAEIARQVALALQQQNTI